LNIILKYGLLNINSEKSLFGVTTGMNKKKPLPPTYFLFSITIMLLMHLVFPISKFIYFPWNLTGLVPMAIGAFLNLIADDSLKKRKTTVKPFEESTTLITSGAFRISRNPMYLGMTLILFGTCILLGSLSPYFVVLIFIFLMDFVFIRAEEAMLEKRFENDWIEYKKTVRRWL